VATLSNAAGKTPVSHPAIAEWVDRLKHMDAIVLEATDRAMATLVAEIDSVRADRIVAKVLDDPLLTLFILSAANRRRAGRMAAECTTITHVLMLYGMGPFFRAFHPLPAVEVRLAAHGPAQTRLTELIHCARHASIQARDFAALRKDREPEEAAIAGLLTDFTEMLLCLGAPEKIVEIEKLREVMEDDEAETRVLGLPLRELREPLAAAFALPETLRLLIDDSRTDQRRVACVHIAADLAHHLEHGSSLETMDADLRRAAEWLGMPIDEMNRIVERNARVAAERSPGKKCCVEAEPADLVRFEAIEKEMGAHLDGSLDLHHMMMLALRGIHEGIGLRRAVFAMLSPDRSQLRPRLWVGVEPSDPLVHFSLLLEPPSLFTQLLVRMQAVWMDPHRRTALTPLLTPAFHAIATAPSFFAMSLFVRGRAIGLVYADQGDAADTADPGGLDANRYVLFKRICMRAAEGLSRLSGGQETG
jgi:HD-like signal output (HDOD) protein